MSKRVKFNENVAKGESYQYQYDYDDDGYEDVRKYGYIEDEIKFTAFNMKAERKYGSIHSSRFGDGVEEEFVFNQRDRQSEDPFLEADNWLDNIVNDGEFIDNGDKEEDDEEEQQPQQESVIVDRHEEAALYGRILEFLRDNETVAKAIKRLGASGGCGKPRQQRVYTKRRRLHPDEPQSAASSEAPPTELPADMQQMLLLSELVNRVVNEFDGYGIYSLARPDLIREIERIENLLQK